MKKILMIEDDKILRENTCEYLIEEGYDVISAEDGLTGLQQAMNQIPDLILCDIMMPRMDGYEFFHAIQQIKHTSTIPVIFLTAKSEMEDIKMGMKIGADDYITKPFDYNDLMQTIKIRLEKIENIYKQNGEKFNAILDNSLVGIFIYNENKFELYNESCAKIFGLSKREFSKYTFEKLIAEEERKNILYEIDKCFKKIHNKIHVVFHAYHAKNTKVKVELFAGVCTHKGKISLIGNIAEYKKNLSFSITKEPSTENISKRELQVLNLICNGYSNTEMAEKLGVHQRTIESHRYNLLTKTNVKNTADLVMYAIRNDLINF